MRAASGCPDCSFEPKPTSIEQQSVTHESFLGGLSRTPGDAASSVLLKESSKLSRIPAAVIHS